VIFLLAGINSAAQDLNLQLILETTAGTPVQKATVSLYVLPAKQLLKTEIISGSGMLSIQKNNNYFLTITSSGLHDTSLTVQSISESLTIVVIMKDDIANLGNVTVISRKPLMKQEDDKTIVDAPTLMKYWKKHPVRLWTRMEMFTSPVQHLRPSRSTGGK
jgi:hypothetical protein